MENDDERSREMKGASIKCTWNFIGKTLIAGRRAAHTTHHKAETSDGKTSGDSVGKLGSLGCKQISPGK